MVKARALAAAVMALMSLGLGTRADELQTLRFAVPGAPRGTPTWTMMWDLWIAKVERDSGGALKLQVFAGSALANLGNVYDRIVTGAADLGSGVQGSVGGKFPTSGVTDLASDITGRDGAAAFWKIYADGLIAAEYADVHVVALWVYPQSIINTSTPLARLSDVKGLKLATMSKEASDTAVLLGAAPLSTSPDQVYEMLQRHAADGVIIGWLALDGFKLAEVTSHHLIAGSGSGSGFLLMNKDAYRRLGGQAKQAIDENSGYEASMAFGADLDRIYAASEAKVRALPGHGFATLDPADAALYQRQVAGPLAAEWQKRIPNGAAIFAAYRAQAARIRDQK